MVWRNPFRRNVAPRRASANKDESDVPWTLLICVLVMALTMVIVLPVLGIMYMDMWNATNAAVYEVKKMRELRRQLLEERSTETNRRD